MKHSFEENYSVRHTWTPSVKFIILKFLPLCGIAPGPINKFKKKKSATLPRQNLMTWHRGATRKVSLYLMLPCVQWGLGGKFWRDTHVWKRAWQCLRWINHSCDQVVHPDVEIVTRIVRYRILWLISACAYTGKRNGSMRLIKDMRL